MCFCLLVASVCQAFAEALQHNKAITILDLRDNKMGDEGGKARVGVLGAWWTFCLLVAFAWQALAEALKHNKAMTTLDLWGNNIGDEGGKAHVSVWRSLVDFLPPCCLCVAGSC